MRPNEIVLNHHSINGHCIDIYADHLNSLLTYLENNPPTNLWKYSLHLTTGVCWYLMDMSTLQVNLYLSTCQPVYLSTCLPIYLSTCVIVYLFTCLPVYLSTCLPVYLSTCLAIYRSTCPPVHLSTCLPIYLFTCLPIYLSTIFLSFFLSSDHSLFRQ